MLSVEALTQSAIPVWASHFDSFSSLFSFTMLSKFIQSESVKQDDVMCGLMTVELEANQRRACVTSD